MSKDKGSKNHKKAPSNKADGKSKAQSDYKSEGNSDINKSNTLDPFVPKDESKSTKKGKGKGKS